MNPKPLSLNEIVGQIPQIQWHHCQNREIQAICNDSRQVTPGALFVALAGTKLDGKEYMAQALAKGAVAIVTDAPPSGKPDPGWDRQVPIGFTASPREVLPLLASLYWGHPERKLTFIGVTGTNGKTTTSFMVRSILEAAGHKTGLFGTIAYWYDNHEFPSPNTTPDALVLWAHFARMVQAGISHVSMEVSSHSLIQRRVALIPFSAAIFTNLGRDHLDYHQTLENYREAKTILFEDLTADTCAAFPAEDAATPYIQGKCKARHFLYGVDAKAQIRAANIHYHGLSSEFDLITPQGNRQVKLNFPGLYNVYNALGAAAATLGIGIEIEHVVSGLENLRCVPGRMEKVVAGQPFLVAVDYAHTPHAMEAALATLSKSKPKRLLVVFGCGGDRDQGKRPQMGQIAAHLADMTWITSDNPRSEPPDAIARQIEVGFQSQPHHVILNRREAIAAALQAAQPGDIVVIMGKGHETSQIIGQEVLPFDDRQVARECLRKLGYGG